MTKLVRWSEDDGGASELERRILRSDRELEPPPGAEALGWTKLSAQLGLPGSLLSAATLEAAAETAPLAPPALAGSSGVTAASKVLVPAATGSFGFLKGVAVGVLFSGALWQAHQWLSSEVPPKQGAAPPGAQAVGVASEPAGRWNVALPVPVAAEDEPVRSSSASAPASNVQASPRSQAPALPPTPSLAPSIVSFGEVSEPLQITAEQGESQLKEEAELLRQARARLRANDLAAAFALLETSRRRFSTTELDQEREALSIELLFRSGQAQAAGVRARAFLAAFPESPHAARLRAFAGSRHP
jgi:hypothetical protein